MLIEAFPAEALDTNCYVVAAGDGADGAVIDPGLGTFRRLDAIVREHRLRPVGVLVTHGHIDHTFGVTEVCAAYGIPAYVHGADAELLDHPERGLTTELLAMLGDFEWKAPGEVRTLTDGERVSVGSLEITVTHAPGHTRGSALLRLANPDGGPEVCFSGDVLFAGSIGRTDLPGGDDAAMRRTLRTRVLEQPDDTVVLPGHGSRTTIGRERAANPFLQGRATTGGTREF